MILLTRSRSKPRKFSHVREEIGTTSHLVIIKSIRVICIYQNLFLSNRTLLINDKTFKTDGFFLYEMIIEFI